MKTIIPAAAALVLALGPAQISLAQDHGRGYGGDHARSDDGGKGGGRDSGRQAERRQDSGPDRSGQDSRGNRGRGGDDRRATAAVERIQSRAPGQRSDDGGRDRKDDRGREAGRRDQAAREVERVVARREAGPLTVFRVEPERGLVRGCPPGLAKRNNGCLPPGQARQIARARYDYLWNARRDDGVYRYDDGYLYRMDQRGSVLGWLPVLGGALAPGAVWPQQYAYQPAPDYYTDYFRLNQPYDYRYANGALYGVDPRTQAITQVVALLTGQPITVGQPMPAGYDVYNVPYPYRSQYADTPDGLYRYSDGYIYRVDPTTQLVQAAIQLLA
ncbi:hypothetical protein [Brevundimonas sp.]|uniref:hypothetical protein n=1 Tax=Brevundimonas sp. TaxID=1871086 RepID=UPI002D24F8F3|nr:hypothetical protein [Brevundimonas sp.]HYD27330.1 hypothetical protein [Brevundimonas sp.]